VLLLLYSLLLWFFHKIALKIIRFLLLMK